MRTISRDHRRTIIAEDILDIILHILSIKHNNLKGILSGFYIYIGCSPYSYYYIIVKLLEHRVLLTLLPAYTINKLPKYRVLLTLLLTYATDKLPKQDTPHRLYYNLLNALTKFL